MNFYAGCIRAALFALSAAALVAGAACFYQDRTQHRDTVRLRPHRRMMRSVLFRLLPYVIALFFLIGFLNAEEGYPMGVTGLELLVIYAALAVSLGVQAYRFVFWGEELMQQQQQQQEMAASTEDVEEKNPLLSSDDVVVV